MKDKKVYVEVERQLLGCLLVLTEYEFVEARHTYVNKEGTTHRIFFFVLSCEDNIRERETPEELAGCQHIQRTDPQREQTSRKSRK